MESQEKNEATARRVGDLVDLLPHGVQECDATGTITYANRAHAQIYECSVEDLIGTKIWNRVEAEESREEFRQLLKVAVRDTPEPTPFISIDRTLRGRRVVVQVDWSYRRNDVGDVVGFVSVLTDITESRRLADELQAERDYAEQLVEKARVIVLVLDPEGRIVRFNPYLEEVSGFSLSDVQGESWFDLFVPERDRTRIREVFSTVFSGERTDGTINSILTSDGTERQIEWFNTKLEGANSEPAGVLAIGRDVTSRVATERDLRELRASEIAQEGIRRSEEQLREAQRIAKVGNWILDVRTNHLEWSDEIYRIFGVDPDSFGATYEAFLSFIHPDDLEGVKSAVEAAYYGGATYGIDHRIVLPDGTEKVVHEEGVVTHEDGEPVRMAGTVQDVTERTQLEEHVRQAQKREAIGMFGAGIAHDFNNILATIVNTATALEMSLPEGSDERALVDRILRATWTARDTVRQIVLFSRPESDGDDDATVNIGEVVEEVVELVRVGLPATVRIESTCPSDSIEVRASRAELHQVLLNLCANAADAMSRSGGVLGVRVSREETSDSRVLLRVTDTGCGIPEAEIERVFEPFFTTKSAGKGTGLGLAMVSRVVQRRAGSVQVKSVVGEGTVFSIRLPIAESAELASSPREGSGLPELESSPRRLRVLAVDDDSALLESTDTVLRAAGHEVVLATGPERAIDLFRKADPPFDVVLSDQTMPVRTGLELAAELQDLDPAVRVVLMSGYSTVSLLAGLPDCVKQVIRKPCSVDEILEAVASAAGPSPH